MPNKVNNFPTDSIVYAGSQFHQVACSTKMQRLRRVAAGAVLLGDGDLVVVSGSENVERREWHDQ